MNTTGRWLISLLIVIFVGASHLLDGPDETTTAALIAADKADAIADARRVARTGE